MHSIEKIIAVLERAPLISYSEPSYRVIADRWRDTPLSAIGAFERGGRYNAPHTFPVLYTADSQMTALLETEALFTTADGQLRGATRFQEADIGRLRYGPSLIRPPMSEVSVKKMTMSNRRFEGGGSSLTAARRSSATHLSMTFPPATPSLVTIRFAITNG